MNATSTLFQQHRNANNVKLHLTRVNLVERRTITHIVNTLKGPPYNMETPNMCFQDTVVYILLNSVQY